MSGLDTRSDASNPSSTKTSVPIWLLTLLLGVGALLNLTAVSLHSMTMLAAGGSIHGSLLFFIDRETRGSRP